jgi:hypothetical protein
MSFGIFFTLWCILIVSIVLLMRKTYLHAKKSGYDVPFPFGNREMFKFIAICTKIYKEYNDIRLKRFIWVINLCYGIAITLFLYQVFFA